MNLDLDDLRDLGFTGLSDLGRRTVYSDDGELGRISHLLIAPNATRADWAVVTNEEGEHHAIPADFLEDDEDDEDDDKLAEKDAIRIGLDSSVIRSLFDVTSPDQTSNQHLAAQLNNILSTVSEGRISAATTDGEAIRPMLQAAPMWHALGLPGDEAVTGYADGAAEVPAESGLDTAGVDASGRIDQSPSNLRSLVAQAPQSVSMGSKFSIEVSVLEISSEVLSDATLLEVEGGSTVTVNAITPPFFVVHGDQTQDINVPLMGNSTPHLFSFTAGKIGSASIRFTAWAGGTYLGKLEVEVNVGEDAFGSSRYSLSPRTLTARRGEVSLQITHATETKTFRFLFIADDADRREASSPPIEGDLKDRIEALVLEFDAYARDDSDLSPADAQDRMRTRGFQLWEDLVPGEIKEAILDHLEDMSQLTIFSDKEIIPWELLYPQFPDGTEPGFLIELIPVTRWVMGSQWQQAFGLRRPIFVLPENSPASAGKEVRVVAAKLGSSEQVTLRDRRSVLDALKSPEFNCLHFSCHNLYTSKDGSKIDFHDGPLLPSDLARMAARRPLGVDPGLVFINACRTQGSAPVYTRLENWARAFLDLGATAVIGTSWAVRSSTARLFAETVYDALINGESLGQAVAAARAAARERIGDSTWLAYTVYGDPEATALAV